MAHTNFVYKDFTARQLRSWAMASRNYDALKRLKIKKLKVDACTVWVQFNAERHRSTNAKVDRKSLEDRPCFLCKKNRPIDQLALPVLDGYEVLVNPFPIFAMHYTIPKLEHRPQLLVNEMNALLHMSRQLAPLVVFYNGPFCGASAPDHLHFQAFERTHYLHDFTCDLGKEVYRNSSFQLYAGYAGAARHFVIKADTDDMMQHVFQKITSVLEIPKSHQEPMMNVLVAYANGHYFLKLIPRSKHRPDMFYAKGEQQVRISPASVDLSGLLVVPFKEDFDRINDVVVKQAFDEVCFTKSAFGKLQAKLIEELRKG